MRDQGRACPNRAGLATAGGRCDHHVPPAEHEGDRLILHIARKIPADFIDAPQEIGAESEGVESAGHGSGGLLLCVGRLQSYDLTAR